MSKKTWSMADMDMVYPTETQSASADAIPVSAELAPAGDKPAYHNSKIKTAVLLGGGTVIAGAALLLFNLTGSKTPTKTVATAPEAAPEIATNDGWDTAARQSATDAGSAINIPDNSKKPDENTANKQSKPSSSPKPESKTLSESPKPTPSATAPVRQVAAKPAAAPQTATLTPVSYPKPSSVAPMRMASNMRSPGQEAEIKALSAKVDKLASALQAQTMAQAAIVKKANETKPAMVAAAPKPAPAKVSAPQKEPQREKPAKPDVSQVEQVAMVSPAIDGRATARLYDSIKVTTGGNSRAATQTVRIKLDQDMPTSTGLEIPAGAMVAMEIFVEANGMVSGSSTGVWDTKTGQQLNVPVGALVIEGVAGVEGRPLIAELVKPNSDGANDADMQANVWKAVAAGVDGATRADTNSSVVSGGAGTAINIATSGGDRGIAINALGGLAKGIASSRERQAADSYKKIASRPDFWFVGRDALIVVSARPILPVNGSTLTQRVDPYRVPAPSRYATRQR